MLSKGLRNAEVGEQLNLSERTVKGYVSQLFLIFDVTNRTELVGSLVAHDLVINAPCLSPGFPLPEDSRLPVTLVDGLD